MLLRQGARSTVSIVAGNTIWQVTLRCSEMGFHEELYTPLILLTFFISRDTQLTNQRVGNKSVVADVIIISCQRHYDVSRCVLRHTNSVL